MNNPHFVMPKVQVLVADQSRARTFTVESPKGPLKEVRTDVNPEGRLHQKDLVTDRPGRQHESMGEGRSAMDESTDPKVVESQRFAKELAERLNKSRKAGDLERLYLVAPPKFLGEVRKHLKDDVKALMAEEIGKDLSHLDAAALRKHLPELLK